MRPNGKRIAVLDLGSSNLSSVTCALARAGANAYTAAWPDELDQAEALVFPGVANFGYLCGVIDQRKLRSSLVHLLETGIPYLGICVGFQLLFERSEEAPGADGLGVFAGCVGRLRGRRVPHIGWSRCEVNRPNALIASGWAYYAHSYAPPADSRGCVAVTCCDAEFAAACIVGPIAGVQFHPEKSGDYGALLLRRWLEACDAV